MPLQNRPNHVETQQMVSDSVFMDPAPTISHKNPVQSPPISLEAFISSISQWTLQQEAFNANISLELSGMKSDIFNLQISMQMIMNKFDAMYPNSFDYNSASLNIPATTHIQHTPQPYTTSFQPINPPIFYQKPINSPPTSPANYENQQLNIRTVSSTSVNHVPQNFLQPAHRFETKTAPIPFQLNLSLVSFNVQSASIKFSPSKQFALTKNNSQWMLSQYQCYVFEKVYYADKMFTAIFESNKCKMFDLMLVENGNTFFGMKVFIFDPGGDIFDVHYVSEKWPIYGDSQITNDNFDKEEVEVEVEPKNVGAMLNISLSSTVENLKSTLSLCEVLKQRLQADIFNNVGKGIVGILRQDGINVCKLHALSTHNIYPNTISFAHQIPLQTEYMLPPSSLTYNSSTPPFTHVLHHYPTKVLDNSSTKLSPPSRGCSLDKLIASLAEMKFSSTKKFASAAVKKAEPMKNTPEWKATSILTENFKAMLMASISLLVRVGNDLVIQGGIILAPDVVDNNICDTDLQARRKNCQCAMQYSWSMEARAQRALVNVSALFEPDGPFKRTMTDANVIIKRLREADGLSFGNSAYWISFDEEYVVDWIIPQSFQISSKRV